MPTALDRIIRPIAAKLTTTYGQTILYTRQLLGDYDVAEGKAKKTEVTVSVKALVEEYGYQDSGAGFAEGLIETSDKKVSVAATLLSFVPQIGDKLVIDGNNYRIERVKETRSGEQVALYELQARL